MNDHSARPEPHYILIAILAALVIADIVFIVELGSYLLF